MQCVFKFGLGWQRVCTRIFAVVLIFLSTAVNYGVTGSGDCGQKYLQGPSGEIMSPGYPHDYTNNIGCKWSITLNDYQIATLSFLDFSIEQEKNCYSGDSLTIIPKSVVYCGSSLPPPYISEVNASYVRVTFTSDHDASETQRGFKIEYFIGERYVDTCDENTEFRCSVGNCIPRKWMCNGMNECSDGSDESNSNCHAVATEQYTSQPLHCLAHQFLCRPLSTGEPACLPESLKCDGHEDCLDNEDEEGCTSVCNYFLRETHGHFNSPNFPRNYDPNLNCFWVLVVGEGNIIQLRFQVFDLEEKYDTDYITVYDGTDEDTADEIGTYYGYTTGGKKSIHMPPSVIEGSGSTLRVVFHTDGSSSSQGFNATFQTKGICIEGQKLCDDPNCYSTSERCDGRMTCIKGEDELGCSDNCLKDQILCFKSPKGCFSQDQRCNGKRDCTNGEDEKYCDPSICRYQVGLFRCKDGTCMEEKYTCDSSVDCQNGEDEENCALSTNIVTAAAVGSIVCGLLLVAALSCTCKLYQLHVRERVPPSHMSPLREIEEELLRREAPPSYTATMASPHFDEAQRAFIEGIQAAVIARNESRSSSRSHSGSRRQRGVLVRMLSRDRSQRSTSQSQVEQDETTTESQTETPSPSHDVESSTPQEEMAGSENSPPPLRRISGEQSIAVPQSAEAQQQESTSSSVSDTDSETNQDAIHLAARDHQILRATANIRRMRLAGGLQNVMQAQDHRAARARSRTGSLVDQAATDSAPEEDSGSQTFEGDPESVAAVGLPSNNENTNNENTNNTSVRMDMTDQDMALGVGQDDTDETLEPSQDTLTRQEAELDQLKPDTLQAEGIPPPAAETTQSPNGRPTPEDKESETKEVEADQDFDGERLSQASSLLSLASTGSTNTGEEVHLLKP